MADAISELVVKITGDASDLESTITSVTGELESLSKVQGGSNSTTTTGTKGLAAYQKQMEKAGETLSTSRTALTNAKKAYEDNTKSISANVSTLKSQQAEINKTISVRSAEKNLLTEANKYLDKNSDAYKDNQKAIKWINNEISAYTEQSDKITESIQTQESVLAGSKKAYEEAQSAVSTATEKYKEYESGLKSVERAAKAQNLQNAGKQLKDVGEGLDSITKPVQYAAAGLAAGGVAAAKFAIDFEDNFANVKKTVDGTDEQFAQIKQDIIDMTTVGINGHSAIPQTTAELTELAAAGGQLGIQTENISSFTETMAMLGTATNLYGEEGAATLAKFANVTKMSQNDFDRLGSSLVALGNNFATNEADIASMSMRLAGAGTQIGLSQADILGIATALSSVGIEAEAGGSAFSKAMIAMQSATSTGFTQINSVTDKTGMSLRDLQLLSSNSSKDFKALADGLGYTSDELNAMIKSGVQLENFAKITGRTSEEFKNLFESNPSEAIDAFIKGLQNADSSGESAIAMLQDMGFTEVRLRDSLLRLANSEAGVTDAVTMSNEAWKENTALQNEFNAKAETTASKIAVVKQNFVEAARGIGETMLPTINDVSSGAVQFAQKLASLDDTQKKTLVNTAAGVVAVGAASKGAVSVIKGVGSAIEGLGKIKGTKVFETIAAGISAIPAPAALAVAGIAALGVAAKVGYDAWYNSQYKWSEGLSEGNEQISESLDKYKQISSLQGEIKDLKLVIENPDSSAEQVEKAKSRLEEIKELLSQEYNLVIKSDNSNLDDAVEKVKNVSKNELQSNINNQMAKLAELRGKMASYEGDYAKDYAEYEKQLNNQTRSSELVNNITAINQAYKEGNITGWERDEQVRELAKSYGMLNTEAMSYNTILNTANGNLKYASGQVEEYKQRLGELTAAHDEYVAVSTEMANWETELLNMSALEGDSAGVEKALTQIGTLVNSAGLDLYGYAQAAALAMNNVGSLDEAWEKGGDTLTNVCNDYVRAMTTFGASVNTAVSGAALLKNGFSDIQQAVSSGDINGVVNDLGQLGSSLGLSVTQVNLLAQSIGLIPDDKHIEITADGNYEVLDGALEKVNELKTENVIVTVSADGDISVLNQATGQTEIMESIGAVALQVNADGNIDVLNQAGDKIAEIKDDPSATITVDTEVDSSEADQYEPTDKDADAVYHVIHDEVDAYTPEDKTANVTYRVVIDGEVPKGNAKGTQNFRGGMAMVNDDGSADPRELIIDRGRAFIPEGENVILPLSHGAKVYTSEQTKAIMAGLGVRRYADGKNNSDAFTTAKDDWTHYTKTHAVTTSQELEKWVEFSKQFTDTQKDVEDIEEQIFSLQQKITSELNDQSDAYIAERMALNDWDDYGDSAEEAFARVQERNKAELDAGRITWDDYVDNISSSGKAMYEAKLNQSEKWITHEEKYNDMSAADAMDAYKRMAQYTKEYYEQGIIDKQEYIEKATEIDEKYLDKYKELLEEQRDELDKLFDNSKSYIEEHTYFNDWDDYDDDPLSAYQRVNDRMWDDIQAGKITSEEADEMLKELGSTMYSDRREQSENWLDEQKKYFGMESDEYIAGLQREIDYTEEYYRQGLISRKEYNEGLTELNHAMWDEAESAYEDALSKQREYISDLKTQFSDEEQALRDSWDVEDRAVDIADVKEQLEIYSGAVTDRGQQKYKELQEQLLQLERDEELYNLQVKNNATIEKLEAEYTELEDNKTAYIKGLASNVDINVSGIVSSMSAAVSSSTGSIASILTAILDKIGNVDLVGPTYSDNRNITVKYSDYQDIAKMLARKVG